MVEDCCRQLRRLLQPPQVVTGPSTILTAGELH
jgi:hypothetical protein